MKKTRLLITLIVTFSLLLAGCGSDSQSAAAVPQSEAASGAAERAPESGPAQTKTAKLWPGTINDSLLPFFESQPLEYTGELTVEMLAEGLSETTGLDYFVTAKKVDDGFSVDWAADSTLIANLDDREQKAQFHFYEADSMRWFMMDSLLLTINDNLDAENVYYTMDSGKDLAFEELYPIKEFPADLPYMGSVFFFAHADGAGDDMAEGRGDLIEYEPIGEEEALELIQSAMTARGEAASTFLSDGEETIEGEYALTFAVGEKSADGQKFTALYHYAVTDSGNIYYIDPLQGPGWIYFDPAAMG